MLYTRAALEPSEVGLREAKNKSDFFYVDPTTKEPVIPGSGLRGVVRSVLEIVTNSKLQPVTDRQLFYRTLDTSALGERYRSRMTGGDPNVDGWQPLAEAGYMEKLGNRYFLRPARTISGVQHYRVTENLVMTAIPDIHKMAYEKKKNQWSPNPEYRWRRFGIWFKPVPPTRRADSASYYADVTEISTDDRSHSKGWEKGELIACGWVPSKGGPGKTRHWIIGPPNDLAQSIPVDDIDIDAYRESGAGITQKITRSNFSVLPNQERELIPCFYVRWQDSEGRKRIAFGHTAMFRLPYTLSPRDLLPAEHRDVQAIDMAEAIFGRVVDEGNAIAGRVYFGDAKLTTHQQPKPEISLLLSGPKPTAVQQYLVQPSDEQSRMRVYDPDENGEQATLRGHKLYWHRGNKAVNQAITDAEQARANARDRDANDTQTTRLCPVAAGTQFTFTVRFENLSKVELGALIWALQLPECKRVPGVDYCHKMGMGKPAGLGSVKITATLHLPDRREQYRQLFDGAQWHPVTKSPDISPDEFLTSFESFMLDAHGVSDRSLVDLPRVRTLLTMLRWPGPNYEETRYLTIKSSDNEYKNRLVLPTPLYVVDLQEQELADSSPRDDPKKPKQSKSTASTATVKPLDEKEIAGIMRRIQGDTGQGVEDDADIPVRLKSTDKPICGRRVLGTIARIDKDRIKVNIGLETDADLIFKELPAPQPKNKEQVQQRYAVGQTIESRIIKDSKVVQLSMK
jgi:CRISPR-associated protein (TIGR03986 family)